MNTQHTPGDREGFIAAIASKLAEIEGYSDDELFQLRWSGGSAPEPLGDCFSMDFLPKAEQLMEVIDPEIVLLKQQRDELLSEMKAARQRLIDIDTAMCVSASMGCEVWKHACIDLDKAIAKAVSCD